MEVLQTFDWRVPIRVLVVEAKASRNEAVQAKQRAMRSLLEQSRGTEREDERMNAISQLQVLRLRLISLDLARPCPI